MNQSKRWGATAFWAYCIVMFWLLFGQRIGENTGGCNLVPFRTIRNYLHLAQQTDSAFLLRHTAANLVGNVVMFVPLGFLLPLNWPVFQSVWKLLLWVILILFAIEFIQLFTRLGSFDVDDLILNVIGASMGCGLWRLIGRKLE